MEEYKPNSNKYKAEIASKKIEKVVTGAVKVREKSSMRKIADSLVQEDIITVKSHIIQDVLIPTIKKTISEVVSDGVDMILYGEVRSSGKTPGSKVSYGKFFEKKGPVSYMNEPRNVYDYNDIYIDNRGEAEYILNMMQELIDVYGIVSVADFYDLAGVSGNHVDNKYGWTDIRNAEVVRTRDGYYLVKLPKALPID